MSRLEETQWKILVEQAAAGTDAAYEQLLEHAHHLGNLLLPQTAVPDQLENRARLVGQYYGPQGPAGKHFTDGATGGESPLDKQRG